MSIVSSTSSSLVFSSWLSDDTAHVFLDTVSAPFGAPIVQTSQEKYDRLLQLEFFQTGYSSTHPSSPDMNAYIVSPHRPWILIQEAHLT